MIIKFTTYYREESRMKQDINGKLYNTATAQEIGKEAGSEWMNFVLENTDMPEEWYSLDYHEFLQAVANANCPPFPAFETSEESDAAYEAAWDELQRCKQFYEAQG